MRFMFSRSLRLELVAGLGIALAMPALALAAPDARGLASQTTLTAETRDVAGHTEATFSINVLGVDGLPASGAVVIEDSGKPLAGVVLNAHGHATSTLALAPGPHSLSANYSGDAAHQQSTSPHTAIQAQAGATADFNISIAPATLTLKQGQSGAVVASVTPVNAASLTTPMFVTLSCSGLPDQTSCTFTPENVEISPNATAAVPSSMVLATQAASLAKAVPTARPGSNPVTWAVLLPGTLGFAGLAFGVRRRRWLSRMAMLCFVGLVSTLGTTACAPLYNYRHHGPPTNLPTPIGNYNVVISAQSSNGITATTKTTTMVLMVTK